MDAVLRHRDDGEATWFVNGLAMAKASSAETGGAYALAEHLITPASNPPPHVHVDEEEAFYVLHGEVEFEVAGECNVGRPGSFVLAPRGKPHTFRVLTETARVLVINSGPDGSRRGGFERFVERAGVPAPAPVLPAPSPPDPVALKTIGAECGIDILPPPQP